MLIPAIVGLLLSLSSLECQKATQETTLGVPTIAETTAATSEKLEVTSKVAIETTAQATIAQTTITTTAKVTTKTTRMTTTTTTTTSTFSTKTTIKSKPSLVPPIPPAQSPPASKLEHVISLLGPRKVVDIVFVMARNREVGKRNFYQRGKRLTMDLLKQYASVHYQFARVAYVTFAANASVDYDDITAQKRPFDKCQMFPSVQQDSFPLDAVAYINEEDFSLNGMNDAIEKAKTILKAGQARTNVQQIIILVTDATFEEVDLKLSPQIHLLGVGLGALYRDAALRGVVKKEKNYDKIDVWEQLVKKNPTQKKITSPLHVDTSLNCSSVNSDLHYNVTNTRCFCDVDYGVVRLQCQTGYVDVMDEASSGPAYGRTCINETEFRLSCKRDTCVKRFCTKKVNGDCENYNRTCACRHGGDCLYFNDDFTCRCIDGFYGPFCSINEDDCRYPGICLNNSTCLDDGVYHKFFKCKCPIGVNGDFCQDLPSTIAPIPTAFVKPSPLNISASTIVGIAVAALIFLIILVGIIILIALCLKKRAENKRNYTKRSETGTSTDISKWSVKNRNNLSVRLSKLWKQRSLRGFKDNEGMPSVPWKNTSNLSQMDMQNVSQEEAIFENEVIHDNRPLVENWRKFLVNLVQRNVVQKGMMVNIFTKDIVTTDDWIFNWSEVYTIDVIFGTETNVNVQEEEFFLKKQNDGVACGKSGSQYSHDKQNLLVVAKTKKYLIAAIAPISETQDGSECEREVRLIMNHINAEGY